MHEKGGGEDQLKLVGLPFLTPVGELTEFTLRPTMQTNCRVCSVFIQF